MKIFKRKEKKKKLSKGNVFLKKLNDAVRSNENKNEFHEHFFSVLEKADDFKNSPKQNKFYTRFVDQSLFIDINEVKTKKIVTGKFNIKMDKIKKSFIKNWKVTKEFGREIKYWFIAEYKIIRKLTYALSRKKDEMKIRNAFENNISMFVNKYGYDKGMERFYNLATTMNNGVRMHKRINKIRR